jgi:tetratricopeptide (TPR) repeat protein
MAAVSAAALALVAFGGRSAANRMRADLALHVDQGGIVDLDRALALGRRLVVADETDAEAAAAVAFVDAVLAVDYGLDTAREARTVLRRWDHKDASPTEARPVVAAARALLLLRAGDRDGAAHLAASAVAAFPGTPHPLYALGRIRVLNGDTVGGARALKAAIVGSPGFMLARVAWAEAHLDLGDAALGRLALQEVLARTPGDLRARLLLNEAEQAIGVEDPVTLSAACPPVQGRWPPASIKAGCALVRATAARRSGARAEALVGAEDAAGAAPAEARLLARVAQALAQLGALDRAAELLERARRFAAPETPALAWAGVAVALGRGRAASLPGGPPPADPEIRLLRARAALAAGGVGALVAELDGLGAEALKRDVDLRLLARLGGEAPVIPEAIGGGDPVHAYVDGLRARLAGNLPAAAASLRNALSGHGDACRAAGEYVVILRVLKLGIDPAAWRLLRAENASCVNLR